MKQLTSTATPHYITPQDGIQPGGRLQHFMHQWKQQTTHSWSLSVISQGYQIQWDSPQKSWRHKTMRLSLEDQQAVDVAVKTFLQSGIIEVSPTQNRQYLSNFFTIQEKTKRRPILDCQILNKFVQCHHFKMEGLPALRDLIEPKDFMCKIDLKDAYVVVPIHPSSRPYLSFMNQGIVYQYRSLAFGLSVAPRVFSKLMRFAMEPLRKQGIRLVYYLDDICILASTKTEAEKNCKLVTNHLESLGFIINYQKSALRPSYTQEFLGFTFNTEDMNVMFW